ncbi:18842_t:CDS:2 [Racocetra fulgida]|uniref:18842_t:CDS:1 n=1 Tax=Racocetra fulgida TaxID=60492 RepID=A0A9N8WLY8_9GLOM|nr:18842_t:CDS:2 [Racocetra fulgida]
MPCKACHLTLQEKKEAEAARKRKYRIKELETQWQQRRQQVVLAESSIPSILEHLLSDQDNIAKDLKTMLNGVNPYVQNFWHISNISVQNIKNLSVLIRADIPGLDLRTYNLPTASQIAAI